MICNINEKNVNVKETNVLKLIEIYFRRIFDYQQPRLNTFCSKLIIVTLVSKNREFLVIIKPKISRVWSFQKLFGTKPQLL